MYFFSQFVFLNCMEGAFWSVCRAFGIVRGALLSICMALLRLCTVFLSVGVLVYVGRFRSVCRALASVRGALSSTYMALLRICTVFLSVCF